MECHSISAEIGVPHSQSLKVQTVLNTVAVLVCIKSEIYDYKKWNYHRHWNGSSLFIVVIVIILGTSSGQQPPDRLVMIRADFFSHCQIVVLEVFSDMSTM